jgi:hypothetical protein
MIKVSYKQGGAEIEQSKEEIYHAAGYVAVFVPECITTHGKPFFFRPQNKPLVIQCGH